MGRRRRTVAGVRRRRSAGGRREAAVVARVALRYDDAKADLVHDEEYEAVLFPLADRSTRARRRPSTTTIATWGQRARASALYRAADGRRERQDVLVA